MAYSSSRPVAWAYETWPVAELVKFEQHTLASDKVDALVDALEDGQELPAPLLLVDGAKVVILDGHHRIAAWAKYGMQAVAVLVARPK